MGRLQLGKKFKQIIQSDQFQQASAGAVKGALGSLQSRDASTNINNRMNEPIPKEYIVALAVIISALISRGR